MPKAIYLKTKTEHDAESVKLKAALEAHTGKAYPELSLRELIQIEGEPDAVSLELCKKAISSAYCETVSEDDAPAERTITLMTKPGHRDTWADGVTAVLMLNPYNEGVSVRVGRQFIFAEPLNSELFEAATDFFCDPLNKTAETSCEKELYRPAETDPAIGYNSFSFAELSDFKAKHGLKLDMDDMMCIQNHFLSESRDPTLAELMVIDRFFGEDFRHTTFETLFDQVNIEPEDVSAAWEKYESSSEASKHSLAGLAENAKSRNSSKALVNVEDRVSGIKIKDDSGRELFVSFRGESHNRSVSVDPENGAAGCLSEVSKSMLCRLGYISDVYRVSGMSDTDTSRKNGELSALGFNNYASATGVPCSRSTGIINDSYGEKHLECCAAIAVSDHASLEAFLKKEVKPGDIVYLVGGKTGRDGSIRFAGSDCRGEFVSVSHPGIMNALKRTFLRPDTRDIISSLSYVGSGGIICAIGNLEIGAVIHTEKIPIKHTGMSPTELILSESAERMIVCVDPHDAKRFREICHEENLPFAEIAEITDSDRIVVTSEYDAREVSIATDFLLSGGTEKHRGATVDEAGEIPPSAPLTIANAPFENMGAIKKLFAKDIHPNIAEAMLSACGYMRRTFENGDSGCSESEADESAGGLMLYPPFSSKTPDASVRALNYFGSPVIKNGRGLCTVIGFGTQPDISRVDPYKGAYLSVVEATMKAVTSGFGESELYLALQEYLPEHKNNGKQFGMALASMLGALEAQKDIGISCLGGRSAPGSSGGDREDNSSVTAFVVGVSAPEKVISRDFKHPGSTVVIFRPESDENGVLPDPDSLKEIISEYTAYAKAGKILSALSVTSCSAATGIIEMCHASGIGFSFEPDLSMAEIFDNCYGAVIAELAPDCDIPKCAESIGKTIQSYSICCQKETLGLKELFEAANISDAHNNKNELLIPESYPISEAGDSSYSGISGGSAAHSFLWLGAPGDGYGSIKPISEKIKVIIPVNNHYSTAVADIMARLRGSGCDVRTVSYGEGSITPLARSFENADIIYIPDCLGHLAFSKAVFSLNEIKNALASFRARGGLIYGEGNGFEILMTSGLLELDESRIGFCKNPEGGNICTTGKLKCVSNLSPMMRKCVTGEIYDTLILGNRLRLCADNDYLTELAFEGRIASQFTNGTNVLLCSDGIDAISSRDGRVLGRLSRPTRLSSIRGFNIMPIAESAVWYFDNGKKQ